VVSSGQPVVPDVVGMTEADANSAIAAAGLIVGAITYQYSDTVPVGCVISQNPIGGTPALVGSSVDLVVSAVVIPDVVEMTKTDANSVITDANLVVGNVTYEYSDTIAAGLVISQNPAAGTAVPMGSSVDLVVSLGQPIAAMLLGGSRLVELQTLTPIAEVTRKHSPK